MDLRKPFQGEETELIKIEEDHFHDAKSALIKPSKCQEPFVAFANSDGGELFVGIEDRKVQGERIRGFKKIEDANPLIHVLLEETNPSVENLDLEFIDFSSKGYVLHIIIPKSPRVHYTSKGDCFIRVNADTQRIIGERVTQLSYSKGIFTYEKATVNNIEIETIVNSTYLNDYLVRIKSKLEKQTFLYKQKLLNRENNVLYPNVGCILLFDEEPQASLDTRCAIKVYRLRTTEKSYKREYLEDMPVTIDGPIEQQIYKCIDAVQDYLKDASYIEGTKTVKLQYPADALKEILVNAVIHRDYSLNDDIHVRIYDNRMEIQSPGKLPGYITVKNILDERFSRNPNIVRLLHKLPDPVNHDIGEGLNTAFNEMHKAGLVAPIIDELDNAVLVTIKHQRLASLEDIIIDYLEDHDFITNKIVRELSGEESENVVKHAFQRLRKQERIEPIDPDARVFVFKYKKS
jgi:ATP-dependent DNA helicase RecG